MTRKPKKNLASLIKETPDHRVFFMDESRFGTHSKIGHGWFRKGTRTRVKIKLGFKNFYVYSAIEPSSGAAFSLILPNTNTHIMNIFLKEMALAYRDEKIVIIMDGAGWHRSKDLALPVNIKIIHLPPYSPELNPVEIFWQQIKRITIRNKTYDNLEDLELAVSNALNLFTPQQITQICQANWIN